MKNKYSLHYYDNDDHKTFQGDHSMSRTLKKLLNILFEVGKHIDRFSIETLL